MLNLRKCPCQKKVRTTIESDYPKNVRTTIEADYADLADYERQYFMIPLIYSTLNEPNYQELAEPKSAQSDKSASIQVQTFISGPCLSPQIYP